MDALSGIWDFRPDAVDFFAISLIASGVLTCFFGYRLFKIVLGVSGFVAGGSLSWTLLTGASYEQPAVALGALLGALLGAAAMFYVGVFLFGCSLGLLVALVVLSVTGSELNMAFGGVFSAIGGLFTLLFRKMLIVVSTGLTGAWSVLSGVSYFVEDFDFERVVSQPDLVRTEGGWYYLLLGIWVLLGIGGIGVQMRTLQEGKPGAR
jgi:hypothetical protein